MPFINLKTTTAISLQQEEALRKGFFEACKVASKPESYVMLGFEENCRLYFRGSNENCAYIEVNLLGSASGSTYGKMTAILTDVVCKQLSLSPDRVYVKYSETPYWGFSGSNF